MKPKIEGEKAEAIADRMYSKLKGKFGESKVKAIRNLAVMKDPINGPWFTWVISCAEGAICQECAGASNLKKQQRHEKCTGFTNDKKTRACRCSENNHAYPEDMQEIYDMMGGKK